MGEPHRKRVKSYNLPGDAHELTFSCFRRLPLLNRDRTRHWFLEALATARRRLNLALWAYVIMPEHVHVIIWPRNEDLPSAFDPLSTNGMDIQLSAMFSDRGQAATTEPHLLGNYTAFFEHRQPISLQTCYEGEQRGIFASLILKESTENAGTFTNEYKLILLDPVEGGVEIWGDERAALADEVISLTVSFNTEYVSSYVGEATPIETGLSYLVEVPVFGYGALDFTTKTR